MKPDLTKIVKEQTINWRRIKELEYHVIPKLVMQLKNTPKINIENHSLLQMRLEQYCLEYKERTGKPYKYEHDY